MTQDSTTEEINKVFAEVRGCIHSTITPFDKWHLLKEITKDLRGQEATDLICGYLKNTMSGDFVRSFSISEMREDVENGEWVCDHVMFGLANKINLPNGWLSTSEGQSLLRSKFDHITNLDMSFWAINLNSVTTLVRKKEEVNIFKGLKKLDLIRSINTHITLTNLIEIKFLEGIKDVNLSQNIIDDYYIRMMISSGMMLSCETLNLSYCRIERNDLSCLEKLPNLKSINLSNNDFREEDLDDLYKYLKSLNRLDSFCVGSRTVPEFQTLRWYDRYQKQGYENDK